MQKYTKKYTNKYTNIFQLVLLAKSIPFIGTEESSSQMTISREVTCLEKVLERVGPLSSNACFPSIPQVSIGSNTKQFHIQFIKFLTREGCGSYDEKACGDRRCRFPPTTTVQPG